MPFYQIIIFKWMIVQFLKKITSNIKCDHLYRMIEGLLSIR